jgi:hypothetical protein
MMHRVSADNIPVKNVINASGRAEVCAYFTGPSSSSFAFVSASRGVEASTQTPPSRNLIAVDRPPKGKIPNRVKGLMRWNE